ncbi:CBS domain-containing protein [Polaribacter sp. MSW13]|uniref:CBS domain-containing protein n=1 Tax=Polaribacter marinus TaxID=2916838 RepID=A0A9X1VMS4_9FLAO|nr:CBS domain-containing protein [Polaribacter marinus]MCI2228903.1 CBS domain-containing protein [Polaribacter marinus]
MKKRELVSKIMSTDLITVNHTNNLVDAEKLFKENSIRHIPVVNGDDIIGMLSLTDLLRITFVDDYSSEDNVDTAVYSMLSIEQVMVKNLISVKSTQTIKEVVEILAKNEFHALPVVDDSKLVGIVTTTDILNYLLKQY